nr:PAS domain S-box protein [Nitrospirota bacterium]
MSKAPSILLIDDNELIRGMATDLLRQEFSNAQIREVDSLSGLQQALEAGGFDIAITDYQLGWTDGLAVLRAVKNRYPDCPVVMFTGTGSEEIAVEAMRAGLDDYVLKSSYEHALRLSTSVRTVLAQAEERRTARETEARYRSLINDVLDTSAVGLFILDASFKVVWINEAVERYFGLRRADVIGQDKRRLIQERIKALFDQPDEFAARFQSYERNDYELCFECHMPAADGRDERWLEHRSMPIRTGLYAGGRIEHYYDITGRKQAEEALRENEQQLRLFTLATNDLFWNLDLVSGVLMRSIGFIRAFGYTAEEMTQDLKWWEDRLHPDDRERVLSTYRDALARGDVTCSYEYRFRRRDNSYAVISDRAYIVRDKTGKPIRSLGSMTDITERKRAEQALRESESRFRSAFEKTAVGMVLLDINGRFLRANPAFCTLVGYSEVELLSKTFLEITHPEDLEKNLPVVKRLMAGEIESFFVEKRYLHKLGHPVWVHASVASVRDAMGRPLNLIAQSQDITERKRTEEVLRRSEERFKTIFEQAPMGIALINSLTGHIHAVNARFAHIAGRTVEEMTHIDWMSITHPDDVQKDLDNMALLNAGAITGFQMEKRYLLPAGNVVWINMTIAPVTVEDKTHPRHLCMIEDITERKRAEEALLRERLKLQSILESASDGIHVLDEAGNVVLVNRTFCEMLGYSVEEALRLNVADWDVQWTREELLAKLAALVNQRRTFETRYRRRDGTILDVEVSATDLSIEGKRFIYAASRDIVARKILEWKAQQANEQMTAMIQSSPMAITVLDAEGAVRVWNQAAERIFGWSAEEVLGRPLPTVPEEKRDEHRQLCERVLRDEAFTGLEVVRRRKDGSPVTISLSTAPLRNAEGRITGVMGIMADVTERKQMERNAGRIERLAALGQLLGGIAHEIKNPLFVLAGRLQLLREKLAVQDYGALPSDLDKIEEAAKRIAHVAERFLTLARPAQPLLTQCDVRAILNETLSFLSNELMKSQIRLVTELPPDLPVIRSDPRQLQEAILNLLLNAMQAMVAAHGKGTLRVNAKLSAVSAQPSAPAERWIEVRIQDDGPGILPEHKPKLFEPFFSTKPPGEGTGLGLWTVRTVVMALGGTVTCESEAGHGATFILRLPTVPPDPTPQVRP